MASQALDPKSRLARSNLEKAAANLAARTSGGADSEAGQQPPVPAAGLLAPYNDVFRPQPAEAVRAGGAILGIAPNLTESLESVPR